VLNKHRVCIASLNGKLNVLLCVCVGSNCGFSTRGTIHIRPRYIEVYERSHTPVAIQYISRTNCVTTELLSSWNKICDQMNLPTWTYMYIYIYIYIFNWGIFCKCGKSVPCMIVSVGVEVSEKLMSICVKWLCLGVLYYVSYGN
jgi:hypothetical protein